MSLDAPQWGEPIPPAEQIALELRFQLRPAEADIPDVGAVGVIDAAFAQPLKGGLQDGAGGHLAHPICRFLAAMPTVFRIAGVHCAV